MSPVSMDINISICLWWLGTCGIVPWIGLDFRKYLVNRSFQVIASITPAHMMIIIKMPADNTMDRGNPKT